MSDPVTDQDRALLRALFDSAVQAALPERVVPRYLPPRPKGRTVVVGAGKASAAMASALEQVWNGPLEGLVITRYGHGTQCQQIEIIEAAHPLPDAAGVAASARILALVQGLEPDDLVIALISGGGSALLSLPAPPLTLADKQAVNAHLLRVGAPIDAMNCLRKHLSAIKGGRLAAAAWPAPCHALLISDVPGDDPSVIASGPTVADPTSQSDARAILARFPGNLPKTVLAALIDPANESPKPGDPRLAASHTHLIATPMQSLEAAAQHARQLGLTPVILGDAMEGEARDLGRAMAREALARQAADEHDLVLLSGGETTVTLSETASGTGGRNVDFLMGLAEGLDGTAGITALACDTDGIDGGADIAGAMIAPDTIRRAELRGYPLQRAMATYDGHGFFARVGDQIISGPTLTNVNDFRAILIR